MNNSDDIIKANESLSLMNNPAFKLAISGMEGYIDQKMMGCDISDKQYASDIINCKQLLTGIIRELARIVENGNVADIRIKQLEKQKRQAEPNFQR